MKRETLEFINGIKNDELRKAMLSHGLADTSQAGQAINAMKARRMLNSTEPRMTLYTAEINPYLYSSNDFMMKSQNDAQFASSGETKLLNNSAFGPEVTKGRFYPKTLAHGADAPVQTVKVRKNTSNPWEIEYFHTTPDSITRELTSEVPYEARGELLKAHADIIMQSVGNFTAVEWAQGVIGAAETVNIAYGNDQFVFTSGSTARATAVTGGTGTVKVINKQDMQNLKKALQRQQVIGKGAMYFLPTVEQYDDLLNIPDFINYEKLGRESKLIMGEVGVLYGITILEPRHREDWNANILYAYTAAAGVGDAATTDLTKIEDTASAGANMTSGGIAWVETLVLRAQGSAIVFPWMNSPIYMGDVYAVEMRYGANKKRADNKGVVMLIDNPFV